MLFLFIFLHHLDEDNPSSGISILYICREDVDKCNADSKIIRFGEPGHRSPYLSHAKRALYHLS